MNRSMVLLVLAITLAGYGIYTAAYVPGMVGGPPESLLLFLGFLLQVVFALTAAVGIWRGAAWASAAVLLLGVSIAGTALIEGFVLSIIAYLRALLVAGGAVIGAWIVVVYLRAPASARLADQVTS